MAMSIPEWCRPEFLDGEIVVKSLPPGSHEGCLSSVVHQVIWKSGTEMDFSGHKGLRLTRGTGRLPNFVIPDGTWVPTERRLFRGAKPWMPGEGVTMVAEVTSIHPQRDRDGKRRCYALGGIPLYLLIDRERGSVTLFSEPGDDDYQQVVTMPFGKEIALPAPFSMTLETTDFA